MLFREDGLQLGAISGGCVEKDVWNYSKDIFKTGKSKTISYDGRYRLGCEGIIYILIEPLNIEENDIDQIKRFLFKRKEFKIDSYYVLSKDLMIQPQGSVIHFDNKTVYFNKNVINLDSNSLLLKFSDTLTPKIKLFIIWSEDDASQLCACGKILGWEIIVVGSPNSSKTIKNFPDADDFKLINSENFKFW